MLKLIVVFMALVLTQSGCGVFGGYTDKAFQPSSPPDNMRQEDERLKREFLQIEDLKIGRGPLAAHGRKITADVTIRYAGDGTLAYEGPVHAYWGIKGATILENSLRAPGLLIAVSHPGILLGLNGMAVGGTRRFTIAPTLSCAIYGAEEANPGITCKLVQRSIGIAMVRKEAMLVEATLTEACAPLSLVGRRSEDICRDMDLPKREPGDPIWRMYYAEPLQP